MNNESVLLKKRPVVMSYQAPSDEYVLWLEPKESILYQHINGKWTKIGVSKLDLIDALTKNLTQYLNPNGAIEIVYNVNTKQADISVKVDDSTIKINLNDELYCTTIATIIINDLTHTDTDKALSAYMGKVLNDKISTLLSRGKFLSIWNPCLGLPVSFPEAIPYTYHTGDYYIVSNPYKYKHEIAITGTGNYTGEGSTSANGFTVSFDLYTDSGSSLAGTNLYSVAAAISGRRISCKSGSHWTSISGPQSTIDEIAGSAGSALYFFSTYLGGQSGYSLSGTVTDTVTSITTYYKPLGSSFTGTSSSVSAEPYLKNDDSYYYDGSSWVLFQHQDPSQYLKDATVSGNTLTLTKNDGTQVPFTSTDTTYTFGGGTNGFSVTSSSGYVLNVPIAISISQNITGVGEDGYLAKFDGTHTITKGPQLGSDTTKYLRNDGTWATPSAPMTLILSDWNLTDSSAVDFIKNKPTIGGPYLPLAGGTMSSGNSGINMNSGSITNAYSITALDRMSAPNGFYLTSDARKKNIIEELSLSRAYDLIEKCTSIVYTLKEDPTEREQIGLIALEVEEFFPEIVNTNSEGFKSLDYSKLTVVILRVLKDLIIRVNKLEEK